MIFGTKSCSGTLTCLGLQQCIWTFQQMILAGEYKQVMEDDRHMLIHFEEESTKELQEPTSLLHS